MKKGKKGGRAGDAETALQLSALESENESLRERNSKGAQEITELKEKVADLGAQVKQVTIEKSETEANLRLARKRVDELEQDIINKSAMTDTMLAKNDEALKNKSHTQKMQLQLYQENEDLQNQVQYCQEYMIVCNVLYI